MKTIFKSAGVPDMDTLPEDTPSKAKFAKLFREFSTYLQAARIQGFTWNKREYSSLIDVEDTSEEEMIQLLPTEDDYLILNQRYKELRTGGAGPGGKILLMMVVKLHSRLTHILLNRTRVLLTTTT